MRRAYGCPGYRSRAKCFAGQAGILRFAFEILRSVHKNYTSLPFNDPVFNSPGHKILTLLLGGFFRHIGAHEQF